MKNPRRFSAAFVAVLMVLAAGCTAVAFTDTSADTNAQMQQPEFTENEPNDDRTNATPVVAGTSLDNATSISGVVVVEVNDDNGTVINDDVDWFRFNATEGQAIRYVFFASATPKTYTLYGPDGQTLAEGVSPTQNSFSAGAVAPETGTYYLKVDNATGSFGGSYEFFLTAVNPDEFEPNDNRTEAASINDGERIEARIFDGEQDWYAIEVPAGATLNATLEATPGSRDPDQEVSLDLFAPNGSPIGDSPVEERTYSGPFADVSPTNQTIMDEAPSTTVKQTTTVEKAGTYYVRVGDIDGLAGYVDYELTVNTRGAAETPTTPTETPTQTPDDTQTETPQPTTDAPTETSTETQTTTPTPTETSAEPTEPAAEEGVAYYQIDFVVGEPIENLRGPEGTYADSHLIRFVHGSTAEPVVRRSPGAFAYAESTVEERIESHEITVENGTAMVTFTVAEGSEPVELSLVSYEKPGPGWSPATEAKQEFVDAHTGTFGPGTYTLTVALPSENNETDETQTAAEDSATGELSVVGLSADADGDDNNNLNDEYIVYENTGNSTLNLSGWTVTDASGATFTFPDGFTLAPGEQVTLYTGSGQNTESELYWGQATQVWNNGADTMTVRNADGEIVIQASYP